jgi:phytanoyl-CoA hydroxylase
MYIFKNPKIGGDVGPHKDNSYLITSPLSCQGIWISLDEASKDNGCMWGVPGSHLIDPKNYLRRKINEKTGREATAIIPGKDEYDYSTEGAVPLEVPPGSIVLLHGNFLHFSERNTSDK